MEGCGTYQNSIVRMRGLVRKAWNCWVERRRGVAGNGAGTSECRALDAVGERILDRRPAEPPVPRLIRNLAAIPFRRDFLSIAN